MRSLNRADATWDYIAAADYDEFPDFCAESVDSWSRGCVVVQRATASIWLTMADGAVNELVVHEVEFVDAVDPTTVVIRLGAEWEMAILNAFAKKLRPIGEMTWTRLAEYIFGVPSPSVDNAFRRVVVEFFGIHWARWMLTGASATSALAFCPDRTVQPRSPLSTGCVVPQVVSGLVARIVSTSRVRGRKKLRRSAAEPLVILAHKSRYGMLHEVETLPIPSRVVNISRWCSCHCKDPDTDIVVCPVTDGMRDMSFSATDVKMHSDTCIRSAAAHFGVEPILAKDGTLERGKTATEIAKMEYVSLLRE